MSQTERILTRDWERYSLGECVFKPVGLSREELEEALKKAYKEFYSWFSITRRINHRIPFPYLVNSLLTNSAFRQFGK